ncbi:MAG: thioredoxin family protein [Acidobacteriota bacterium]|nr:MAG: thioredoxin family protein [Acidobacteriota bacterium]
MTWRIRILAVLACLLWTASLSAQNVVRFDLVLDSEPRPAGSTFDAVVRAEVESGWHLYSMDVPKGGPIPTTLTVQEDGVFAPGGVPIEPTPIPWFDQNFGMQTNYFEDTVDFLVPVVVKADAPAGDHELQVKIRFMACNDSSCLPPQTKVVLASVNVVAGSGLEETAVLPVEVDAESPADVGEAVEPASGEATPSDTGENGLPLNTLAYIWFAMGMGALALLTPCVFPMIPITVSYFTKRDAKTRGRAVFEAGLYSFGIIATFTLLGFSLTYLFGAGGINRLAASPLVNIFIALIFIVFALSLFGVLEIRLPSSWLSAINKKSTQTKGVMGIFLMALTFSLTSFTCTVPFVGTVMVAALQGDVLWSLLGVTAFATVFSLPFFLLALFPSWLQSLPKSGNWMNSVKITMGFLELAAALKFISNVDLVYQWEFITRPVFITVWLAIGLVMAVYLLGWIRFSHESPTESIGATRVLFAILFLSVSFYLLRGLFGFSLGELDAFLPPRDYGAVSGQVFGSEPAGEEGEHWLSNYEEALEVAQAENKPIFIDFTGYTCTNCRWMEANIFPLPEVQELFRRFVLVRLYTDGTEPEHEENRRLEEERFKTIALPYYAIMSPADEVIRTFPGLTRNKDEFVAFLTVTED